MTREQRSALEELGGDEDAFATVEARLGRFNLFEAVGLTRQEIRHSNFLAFLLDPRESHGLGEAFLRLFLQEITPDLVASAVNLGEATVRREWQNIDLLISCESPQFAVVVENKIGSGEHGDQLETYRKQVVEEFGDERPIVLAYLTPKGHKASHAEYRPLGYQAVHTILGNILDNLPSGLAPDVLLALRHYKELLATHVIDDPELDKLCDEIYQKHRRALDLIFERRAGPRAVANAAIEGWIEKNAHQVVPDYTSSRYIKFVPKAWLPFSFVNDTHKGRERRTLTVLLTSDSDRLNISIELHLGSDAYRKALQKLASEKQGSFRMRKGKVGKQFTTLYSKDVLLPKDYEGVGPDELRTKTEAALDTFFGGDLVAMTEELVRHRSSLVEAQSMAN